MYQGIYDRIVNNEIKMNDKELGSTASSGHSRQVRVCLSASLSLHLSASVCLCVSLSLSLCISLAVCISLCLFLCLAMSLSLCLAVSRCVSAVSLYTQMPIPIPISQSYTACSDQ